MLKTLLSWVKAIQVNSQGGVHLRVDKAVWPKGRKEVSKVLDLRKKIGPWRYRGVRFRYARGKGTALVVNINSGAGYQSGMTAYVGINCMAGMWPAIRRDGSLTHQGGRRYPMPLQVGITRNANSVPYVDYSW